MKLTRERKFLMTVLAVAFAAMGVNAQIPGGKSLSGPSVANAAATTPASTATTALQASGNAVALPSILAVAAIAPPMGPTLAQRLAQFAANHPNDARNQRNAFAPSKHWLQSAGVAPVANASTVSARAFRHAHHLMAVMAGASGRASLAVIDGQPMRVGDTLAGYRLTRIESRQAVFASPGGQVALALPTGP